MLRNLMTDLTTAVIGKSLDAAGMRHRIIADNIANVETPGFKRSEVAFESRLKQALETATGDDAFEQVDALQPEVEPDALSPARPDGNNVSIDKEMTDLTKNTLRYEALVQLLNLKGAQVRSAINGGNK
ncbi:MAG: flagellar basal body rod protein FlgB [Coriobacteriia bacterium]|nr:flagellar basal body rod protein FlgB [Coriobacteriia bacterium]